MSRFRSVLGLPVITLAFAACAQKPMAPAVETARSEKPVVAPQTRKANGRISSITLERFFDLHQSGKALVIDARPSFVYVFGHVPGAVNLPKSRCPQAVKEHESQIRNALAEGKTIIVYCTGPTCPDARAVATHISEAGYPVTVFPGGWEIWHEAGMPAE